MTRIALPIDAVLPQITDALARHPNLVIQAAPGAGKTTRVPVFLDDALGHDRKGGRILMLEPRRVAARSSAVRMAQERGEAVGGSVGYAMRGERKVSAATRIEVVTEGILTRMLQSDPELADVACVIFDEFHERSLPADLGLALTLDVQSALRPDLQIIVMSATLDTQAVAQLLGDATVVTAPGRAFDVETRWADKPWRGGPTARGPKHGRGPRFEDAAADLIIQAVTQNEGGALAFLPGAGEIIRVEKILQKRLASTKTPIDVVPLYGALPFKAQLAALKPPEAGQRKLVLATSIAETSLTIPDVRIVIDCGLARRLRFDAGSGMTRLQTEKVTKAEATQRQGRAGRVAPGVCYRMWTKGEEGGLAAFPPVAMEDDDLMGLALELAQWGVTDPGTLAFLTPPPAVTLATARDLLISFGALDERFGITAHGTRLGKLPFHPRLAQIAERGKALGCATRALEIAALIEARDVGLRGERDLARRLAMFRRTGPKAFKDLKARLKPAPDKQDISPGVVLATGFPDRIARRRAGDEARYLMAGGKGAILEKSDPLAASGWLAIGELDGNPREAAVRLAAPLSLGEIHDAFADALVTQTVCLWDKREKRVIAERQERFGAIVLSAAPMRDAPDEALRGAMCNGVAMMGLAALPWGKASRDFQARAIWAQREGGLDLPDFSDEALMASLQDWLAPHLGGMMRAEDLTRLALLDILRARLDWPAQNTLDEVAPPSFSAPTGRNVTILYDGAQPRIEIRLQEMFGVTAHPVLGHTRVPLTVDLLSPAKRLLQRTADLPGFWRSSYKDVRKDMRARYPKHPWPEDPAAANPTTRAKPRGK